MRSFIAIINLVLLSCIIDDVFSSDAAIETVSKHGRLSVNGVHLVDQYGERIQLKGMSLFWDVWMPQYYNEQSIAQVHSACHSNVVRAAVTVRTDYYEGYVFDKYNALARARSVIEAAIKNDIYVIVDWHSHDAENDLQYGIEFFTAIASEYGHTPNIIYETYNEPTSQSWSGVLKSYHETVINAIRMFDAHNVIIVGTPNWSQHVDVAAADPIVGQSNIMYSLHFYAGTHKAGLRQSVETALSLGAPIFVTEYGTVNADATGPVDESESHVWWDFLDEHSISYVNWAISDKSEAASALVSGTSSDRVCASSQLTQSGRIVVEQNAK